ncbi:class I tRNA ligase family protein [Candidatus Parcubacteria bacterium]|nr:class I tRNA ligase family protein [Candidatus Parcubacteria bacterium]
MAEDKGKADVAKREEEILLWWKENKVFERSLEKPSHKGEFVFYDGPPFATGLPHHGHILGSTSKDLFGRYKTMRGYHVRRRWGWDTHGLPIESIVEKKLGLKSKKDILAYGIGKFNMVARETVLEFIHEWKRYIERIGRFVDFDNSYKTMDATFMESVWWALKEFHKRGKLYGGRRVLMYCTRDETPLAKAEIAMDNTYRDITEDAVTVKFKVKEPKKHGLPENTFFLAWTTTPWTLPGNVALAVGKDIDYVVFKKKTEPEISLVVAKEACVRMHGNVEVVEPTSGLTKDFAFNPEYDDITVVKGEKLVGVEYEPLYEIEKVKAHTGKKWEVVSAGFVTTEDGTGIVHTAVMYGEDDYELGKAQNLPMIPLLNSNGTYNDDVPEFLRGEHIKKANGKIIEDLRSRSLVFDVQPYTHSYPHCYRCGTPLIYNAVPSWFVDTQSIKQKMLDENEKIYWFPEHLKHGRFKNIVENAPDWTISRNRFWASPLPIWKDAKGDITVIGSLEELKKLTVKSGNHYFVMRHGESENNVENVLNSTDSVPGNLTEFGRAAALRAGALLKDKSITRIVCSPLARTKQTAEAVAEALGLPNERISTEPRLIELNGGVWNGRSIREYHESFTSTDEMMHKRPEGGESWYDVRKRASEFLYEFEKEHKNETVLFVTHSAVIRMLTATAYGLTMQEFLNDWQKARDPQNGEVRELPFVPLPHNENFELDVHLPYIDDVKLMNERGELLTRTPEVVDCWVESSCMPFAEYHYPFRNKEEFEKRTPGDFISEYIAQTRTWYYYMHAVAVLLFNHRAFSNVVSTGTILASDGQKMSKSVGNFTDPMILVNQYGADALRYYLMSSVVMQSEDLNFKDQDVKEVHGRVINILRNTFQFYTLYQDDTVAASADSPHVLDRWILSRLAEVAKTITDSLEIYDTVHASRPMREFVEDFSTWYVRRSRERVKEMGEDRTHALATMRYVLLTFSKLTAPVMPFVADEMYRSVKSLADPDSVHLADWPEAGAVDEKLVEEMARVRTLASEALMLRQKANIKVRQPLQSLQLAADSVPFSPELVELLREEINVKQVVFDKKLSGTELHLDTVLTPELVKEGDEREKLRAVADARKAMGLSPKDQVDVVWGKGPYEVVLSTGVEKFEVKTNAR